MRIACTGFVSSVTGSVAAANGILLRSLIERGNEIVFFSKPGFVDPRPILGGLSRFQFEPVVNQIQDGLRRHLQPVPGLSFAARLWDAASYNRMLVQAIRTSHRQKPFDCVLWLGDHAHGTVPGAASVSYLQGAPGSDARSILRQFEGIRALNGGAYAWRLRILAKLRLSRWGLPDMKSSDRFIVGSEVSRKILVDTFGIPASRIDTLPYPIDLDHFRSDSERPSTGPIRVLWLGRMVPRKRLDVFLDGTRIAIARGTDVTVTIVGSDGGLGRESSRMDTFPYPDRLRRIASVARSDVPALLGEHDVLAQPSDEENFGSSVAEAQACGLPVIVGRTNGNADYLCQRDIHLGDDSAESFASAIDEMARRRQDGSLGSPDTSRTFAERTFHPSIIAAKLEAILKSDAASAG